jgi:hypothetical protein
MKRFYVNVINDKIKSAALDAEKLLNSDSKMMKEIKLKNDFKYNSGLGEEIYDKFASTTKVVPVFTYRPKWIFSKAIGYFDGESIHINTRKLPDLSHADIVGLLCHEYSHAVGYSHGNNFPSEEKSKFSVPYFISDNVEKWL